MVDPNKIWLYNESFFNKYGELIRNEVREITTDEIINKYWKFWSDKMIDLKRYEVISVQNCIDDWIAANWAWMKK